MLKIVGLQKHITKHKLQSPSLSLICTTLQMVHLYLGGHHQHEILINQKSCTSPKTNMEPKNWWFVDVSLFPRGIFMFHVSFRGCRFRGAESRSGQVLFGVHKLDSSCYQENIAAWKIHHLCINNIYLMYDIHISYLKLRKQEDFHAAMSD